MSKASDEGYKCPHCGKPFNTRNFYKTNSMLYSNNGYMTLCKECIADKYKFYVMQYHNCKQAIQRICMAFDIYYSDAIYNMCVDSDGNASIAKYIQKTNMVQHKGKTFETSLEEGFYFTGDGNGMIIGLSEDAGEPPIDPKLTEKWGSGFSYYDYQILEEHHKKLIRSNPNPSDNQDIFIDSLCHLYMLMRKSLRENDLDGYAKANEQYSKTFKNAGLKATQEVDIGSDDCWGEWVRRIEDYTPAEYYKNKNLFKDFDNIGDYFKRFVLRPLKNLMHGTTDRDEEFCVKDGDEDEYSEPI